MVNSDKLEFYDGQIVALEGTCESSTKFDAIRIIPATFERPNMPSKLGEGHKTVLYANGPYTYGNSLAYKPLRKLVEKVKKEKPHSLVLGGPFVDCNNEDVRSGEIAYEDHSGIQVLGDGKLMKIIVEFLDQELSSLNTQFVLIPSLKDMVSMFPLPQPQINSGILDGCSEEFKRKTYLMGNPQEFSLDNINCAAITSDVVLHLFQNMKSDK